MLHALAKRHDVPHEENPTEVDTVLQSANALLLLRHASADTFARFDRDWLRAIVSAARAGRIANLTLALSGVFETQHAWRTAEFHPRKRTPLNFWRRGPVLTTELERVRDSS